MPDDTSAGRRERAISPVVGVSLMVVLVVLMFAVSALMLTDLANSTVDPAPSAVTQESVELQTGGGNLENELSLLHTAGEDLPADRTVVQIRTDDGVQRVPVSSAGAGADGEWSPGERLTVVLDESTVCSGGTDAVTVNVVSETEGGSKHLVETREVPVERGKFDIRDGAVVPTSEYTAEVRLLGTAITAGAGGPPIPVYANVTVGDTTTEPWPGDVNDGGNPRSWSVPDQSAGTEITVNATADAPWFSRTVSSQHENSDLVHVLRDGDDAPDTQGFADQADAGSFVSPYVEDDTVQLDGNQAIFLFELGASDPDSAAADFQDAVVLVSLSTTESVRVEDDTDDTAVVCPGG